LIGGQLQDIEIDKKKLVPGPRLKTLVDISKKKTAALFEAASKLGAISSTCSEKKIKALGEYGQNIGLAFQFIDDILDKEGFYICLGEKKAAKKATRLIENANRALCIFGNKAKHIYLFSEYLLEKIK